VSTKDLIVSPRRFSIQGKGQRTIRVLLKKPLGQDEQVYRVKLTPKFQGFPGENQSSAEKKTQLRIITTVGLLILADPLEAKPELVWERKGDNIIIKNQGNSNIYLDQGESCSSAGACKPLPANRLYAGNTWTVTAPEGQKVSFQSKSSTGYEKIAIE
jgi:P pilus assembly chaperone PapD